MKKRSCFETFELYNNRQPDFLIFFIIIYFSVKVWKRVSFGFAIRFILIHTIMKLWFKYSSLIFEHSLLVADRIYTLQLGLFMYSVNNSIFSKAICDMFPKNSNAHSYPITL